MGGLALSALLATIGWYVLFETLECASLHSNPWAHIQHYAAVGVFVGGLVLLLVLYFFAARRMAPVSPLWQLVYITIGMVMSIFLFLALSVLVSFCGQSFA